MRLNYIRLLVRDFPACYRFYRDVMGFKPRFTGGEQGIYEEFSAGPTTLALFRAELMSEVVGDRQAAVETSAADRFVIIFAVESVDAVAIQLKGRGASFVREPHDQPDWMIRVAHLRDPDGNLIEINQPLRRA